MTEYSTMPLSTPTPARVGIRLDELLASVHEPDVVHERRLDSGVQNDRMVVDVADRQIRDRHAAHVAAHPDAERHAAVGCGVHPLTDHHHIVVVAGRAAYRDVGEGPVDVERGRQCVRAGGHDDRRVRRDRRNRVLQLDDRRHVDDTPARRRQRRRRAGRSRHDGSRRTRPDHRDSTSGRPTSRCAHPDV